MARVQHFEIRAKDMENLESFYTKCFQWEFIKEEYDGKAYWRMRTGTKEEPGIGGGMLKKENSQQGVLNMINVPDLDKAIESIKENGGKITMNKQEVPDMGSWAMFKDPEGNEFSIMQKAK